MDGNVASGYVAFDLEGNADRSDPSAHEIIEIGAVAVEGGAETATFTTLVRPTRPLRDFTRELTGLADEDLTSAPALADALADFYRFVGNRPLIAHHGFGYDFPLLDAAGEQTGVRPPDVTRLDSLELAHLVFPRAGKVATADIDGIRPPAGRSLDDLVRHFFGDEPREHHRALGDARLLHRVLVRLMAALESDEPARRLQRWVLGANRHPWAGFVARQPEPIPLEDVVPLPDPPQRDPPTGGFTSEAVGGMFADGGALMGRARRPRSQQVEMATTIADSLLRGGRIRRLIEAPTGTGKTLAYLAPAIEYARAADETVIVAPHSKVLQDQIMATLEELQDELAPFVAVLLKGASNYISLESLAGELDALSATSGDDAPANDSDGAHGLILAMICGWVAQTPTGDWDDLRTGAIEANRRALPEQRSRQDTAANRNAAIDASRATLPDPAPGRGDAADRTTPVEAYATAPSDPAPGRGAVDDHNAPANPNRTALLALRLGLRVEGASGPATNPLDERDFHRRARDGLRRAHVGVLNHALLVTWDGWLDRSKRLVLDEAHNLEDAATDALTEAADRDDLLALAGALWDPARRRGTVHRLAEATRWSLRDDPLQGLRSAADDVRAACARFGAVFVEYVRTRTGARRDDRYAASYGIRPRIDTQHPDYSETVRAGQELRQALRGIADLLNEVNLPDELTEPYRRHRLENEINRLGRHARDTAETIDKVLWAEDPERWIAIGEIDHTPDGWRWGLRRSPLSVTRHLRGIWESLETAVLTSATLRVGNSYSHIIDTLGLDAAERATLGSPFPWIGENHLLLLTDYLPAPRARLMEEFTTSTAAEIPRLLTLTGGRGMALMTARARMEFVRDHARPILDGHGIPLLVQGDDSAPALVERMRAEQATSLLALRSFWEGVDVPGEALSLLIIEKIPFDSPAEPVVGARMAAMELRGKDPFADYVVPRAALRFAQGVGRLIRTESDRGVTVVLDNRLCRAVPYRDRILGTLPGPPRRERAIRATDAYRQIAEHLGDVHYDDEMRRRLEAVASADPWADLAELELSDGDLTNPEVVADRLEQVRERFGFERWRPGQLETMERFIRGADTLAVLPTGSGKSITFQIPALLSPGLTLVISPLTALMNDQVENLRARGVTKVAAIHSGVPQGEWRAILRGAERGDYKLLYVSPERLWSQEFVETLSRVGVARIAVDEAHCISQWGHSFRPEYTAIPQALDRITTKHPPIPYASSSGPVASHLECTAKQRTPILAVTATATKKVRNEIRRLLELDLAGDDPILLPPDRPEIRYYVEQCADRRDRDLRVVQIVEAFRGQAAVVYVPTRKGTTRLAGLLTTAGHNARPYHGRMEQPARRHTEDAFRHGEVDVVVATKAFGMGIDKPDIALVVHLEMPATIEEYVQETGRAARGAIDGKEPSTGTAVLLKMDRDCWIHRNIIRGAAPQVEKVQEVWNQIRGGTHAYDPDDLADDETDREGVDVALAAHYLQTDRGLQRHTDTPWRGRVTIVDDTRSRIEDLAATDRDLAERARRIVEMVERNDSDEYHAETWERGLDCPAAETADALLELNRRDILGFTAWKHAWVLERCPGHEPDWDAIEANAKRRQAVVAEHSRRAKGFAALKSLAGSAEPGDTEKSRQADPISGDGARCRRRALLEYLGWDDYSQWDDPERCGACDGCTRLERPWAGSHLSREALLAALPQRTIVLRLVADTSRGSRRYSRRNLVRTLLGADSSPHALAERLAKHPTFGRLAFLGEAGVKETIDDLVEEGMLTRNAAEYESATAYETLEITSEGRGFLGER